MALAAPQPQHNYLNSLHEGGINKVSPGSMGEGLSSLIPCQGRCGSRKDERHRNFETAEMAKEALLVSTAFVRDRWPDP